MRSLLPVSVLAAAASIAHADRATVAFAPAKVSGKVDAKAVTTTLTRSKAQILACYKKAGTAATTSSVRATFSIDANGRAATVDALGPTASLAKCVAGVLTKLSFAKPTDGLPASVSVRIQFSSGGANAQIDHILLGDPTKPRPFLAEGGVTDSTEGIATVGGGGSSSTGMGYGRLSDGSLKASTQPRAVMSFDKLEVRGARDENLVRSILERQRNRIVYCYEKELAVTPGLAGRVTTDFTIRADGKVSTATAKGVHANVESCVATALKAILFPKVEPTTPDVSVSVPLTFTAVKSSGRP